MSEVIDFEKDILEEAEMGSLYHSTTQARITTLLFLVPKLCLGPIHGRFASSHTTQIVVESIPK